ncbi:MAG: hypothetical protein ABIO43_10130 [Sphingomicrobium sp.]
MFSRRRLSIFAATIALAGCNTTYKDIGSPDPAFGESVKYNAAVHIIDPDPVYTAEGAQPGDNGDRGAQAVRRYRTGQVKQPEVETTTSGGGGSR